MARPQLRAPPSTAEAEVLPGAGLDAAKMPGHWLLVRLGKRVLRPGGLGLTHRLLAALNVLRDREARARVVAMRRVFRKHAAHLAAIMLVAIKPAATSG